MVRIGLLLACLIAAVTTPLWAGEAEQRAAAEAFLKPLGPLPADKYAIALLKDESLPKHDPSTSLRAGPKLADEFAELLRKGGHEVTLVNADQLCNPFLITTDRFDMLFLPACHTLPGEAGPVIKAYCDKGGDLAALGTPAFRNTLAKVGGKWLSKDEWRRLLNAQPTAHMLLDFDAEDLSKWQRHTNAPNSPITRELVPGKEGKALHVVMPNMTGWDGLASPKLDRPFPAGHTLTCLWAKGIGETNRLMLEWREKDGSRWIATFALTPPPSRGREGRGSAPGLNPPPAPSLEGRGGEGGWQRIVLAPSDFRFWQSVPTRGGPGDGFKPENAEQLVLGVAHTHTGPRTGRYEFLIDDIGTAPAPAGLATPQFLPPPILENFSPSYKFYAIEGGAHFVPIVCLWDCRALQLSSAPRLFAHHDRPTGKGFNKRRLWRWQPLAAVSSKDHDLLLGAIVSLYLDFSSGSARLAVGVDDPEWYRLGQAWDCLQPVFAAVAYGTFLQEAGPDFFCHETQDKISASVANLSRWRRPRLEVEFWTGIGGWGHDYVSWENQRHGATRFGLEPSGTKTLPATARREAWVAKHRLSYSAASLSCMDGERQLDSIESPRVLLARKAQAEREFVTARGGDFWLDGKKWYPHGVNYMPSTGIGVEDNEYFEYWLDAKPYDPEFVQRDLERIEAIGFNSVSIFIYHRSLPANNLLDFLRRCDELGLKVDLSLRPGTPMDYKWEQWKEIIEKNRLWEQDVIWAYDIAWEPFFGSEAERKRYDPLWREWLIKKHGSLDAARKALGLKEAITAPTGWQLTHDGEHRKLVSDYRRFADELLHERYLDAYRKIKAIDPNHLISFRMTVTGDPTFNDPGRMPYDFKGVAKAMDFLAPEGYGRIGDWERVKAGLFTVAYARACAPDKPVFWAEAGVSAWDEDAMAATPEKLDFQARFYRDFYRMMLASHSNGVAWWWYPGGYRVNERSDYGIINPDGTDRPVTKVIREFGPKLTAERVIPKPDVWIDVDRDADARGLFGVYEKVKEQFWRAAEQGKTVGLRCVTRDP